MSQQKIEMLAKTDLREETQTTEVCVYSTQIFPISGSFSSLEVRQTQPVNRKLFQSIAVELIEAIAVKKKGAYCLGVRTTWKDFRSLCLDLNIDINSVLLDLKIESTKGTTDCSKTFDLLAPTTDLDELSKRSGYSLSLLQRWRLGTANLSLVAGLIFLDLKGRLFDFLQSLCSLNDLPFAQEYFSVKHRPLEVVAKEPITSLILVAMGGAESSLGPEDKSTGFLLHEKRALKLLEKSGLVIRKKNHYFLTRRDIVIPSRISFEQAKGFYYLKKFWFDSNVQNFALNKTSESIFQGLFLQPCSPEIQQQIHQELGSLYWKICQLVDSYTRKKSDKLCMLCFQLFKPLLEK